MAEIKIQVLLDDAGLQKQIAGANKLLLRFSANAKKLNTKRVREEIQISEKLYRDHDSRRLAQAKRLNQQLLSIHRQRINQETISERSIATTRDRLYRRSMTTGMLGGGAGMAAGGGVAGRVAYSPLAIASILSGGGGGGGAGAATTAAGAAAGAAISNAAASGAWQYEREYKREKALVEAEEQRNLAREKKSAKYINRAERHARYAEMYPGFAAALSAGMREPRPLSKKAKKELEKQLKSIYVPDKPLPPVKGTGPGSGSVKFKNAFWSSLGMGSVARFGAYGAAFLAIQKTMSTFKDMLDYEKALFEIGRTARLTNEDMAKLNDSVTAVAMATGRGRRNLLEDAGEQWEKISKAIGTTDSDKITKVWEILQATGTGKDTIEALDGAFKSLKANEKNVINLANLLKLPGAAGITDLKELAKWLEDMKNKGGIQIFSEKSGKSLRDFEDIAAQIEAIQKAGGAQADFLKLFTPESLKMIRDHAEAMRELKTSVEAPLSGFTKLKDVLVAMTGLTFKPMIDDLNKQLSSFFEAEGRMEFLSEFAKGMGWTIKHGVGVITGKPIHDIGYKIGSSFIRETAPGIGKGVENFFKPYAPEGFPAPTQITILNYGGVRTEVVDTSGRGKKVEVKKVQR